MESALKGFTNTALTKSVGLRYANPTYATGTTDGLSIKPLEGFSGFRLRIGSYRAIYELDNAQLIVTVFNIGSRGDIYK